MVCKKFRLFRAAGLAAACSIAVSTVAAAPLGLVPVFPDITTNSAILDYCVKGSGGCVAGAGFQLSVTGALTDGAVSQSIRFASDEAGIPIVDPNSSELILAGDPAQPDIVLAYGTRTGYSLVANFDATGQFDPMGSFVQVLGAVEDLSDGLDFGGALDADFSSGTLLTGDLEAFGFSGVGGTATLEFKYRATSGDLLLAGYAAGGVIISGVNSFVDSGGSAILPAGTAWTGAVFQAPFGADNLAVDTFVPVPAAVWLLGSGLIGLLGVAGANRRGVKSGALRKGELKCEV